MTKYTREDIESMRGWERPMVRVRYNRNCIDEWGRNKQVICDRVGRIDIDGNDIWVEIFVGRWITEKSSWELILGLLNDPHGVPIHFSTSVDCEI